MRIRARYLLPLFCGLAIVPLGLWHSSRKSAAERLARWEQRTDVESSAEKLNTFVQVPGGEMSLADLQSLIESSTDLEVEFDESLPDWLSANSKDPTVFAWKVETPKGQFRLRTLLTVALNRHDLTYDLAEQRRLIITAAPLSSDSRHRYVETYPLPQPELASSATDEESWAELLKSATDHNYWSDYGGTGHIETVPGALLISQTAQKHREIRRLMTEFMKLESPPADFAPVPLWPDSDAEAHARIFAALDKPAAIDWVERPLDEGLNALALTHGIPLVINFQKLEEAAIPRDLPITKRLSGVSLRSLLRLMLSELELTYLFEDGALVITTPDHASAGGLMLVAYPVHDLVGQGPQRDYDPLIELITTAVHPQSWDEVGGPSSLDGGTIDGWLLVSQSLDAQEGIEFLLSQLRKALRHDSVTRVFLVRKEDAREDAIRKALRRDVELQYDSMPLKDAMNLLSDILEIPIVISAKKLEEAAVGIDTPVRMRFPKRPARQQLNSMLSELELTWLIDDEVLQITTPDDAHSPDRLTTRLYDLRMLADPDLGAASGDQLIQVVREAVEPASWDEVGGSASLRLFEDVLIVSHHRRGHELVEQFLAAVQQHCTQLTSDDSQPTWVDPHADPRDAQIAELLLKPVDFTAKRTSLVDALERLSVDQNLSLVVSIANLENYGIDPKVEIDLEANGITIGGVLNRLLEPFGATYISDNGALLVTTIDNATRYPTPRLYSRQQVARKIGRLPNNLAMDLINELPRFNSKEDIGMSIELNHQWMVFYASQPVQRRLALKLAPERSHAQAVAERIALDREREETSDWQGTPLGYRVTAAQQSSAPPPGAEVVPAAEDFE